MTTVTTSSRVHPPPNIYLGVPGTRMPSILGKVPKPLEKPELPSPEEPVFVAADKADLPPLIAFYGTASASTWLEDRYKIWRGEGTTAENPKVQGYLKYNHHVFAWGDPLCLENKEARKAVAEEMTAWAKKSHLHMVWCCVGHDFAEVLAEGVHGVGWSTLSCIQEDMLHPATVKLDSHDVKHNVRRAQKESVNVEELRLWEPDYMPDPKTKQVIEDGIEAWRKNRKGRQIASASLLPWLDASSRRYYVARVPGKIVGLCILTPIAHDSYQIKNSIVFPDAPRGTSELLLTRVIEEMRIEGKNGLTFGTSATEEFHPEANLGGWRVKAMAKGYKMITKKTGLTKRGDFRAKFETEGEPLYVCFPPHGFGWSGVAALFRMLKA